MKRMPSRLSRLLTGGYRLLDLVGLWIDQAFALTRDPTLTEAARSTLTAVEEQQQRDRRGFRQHERCSRLVASVQTRAICRRVCSERRRPRYPAGSDRARFRRTRSVGGKPAAADEGDRRPDSSFWPTRADRRARPDGMWRSRARMEGNSAGGLS